jgi:hypothetical protein
MPKASNIPSKIISLLKSGCPVKEVAKTLNVSSRYVYDVAGRHQCPTNSSIRLWGRREHKLLRRIVACSQPNYEKVSKMTGMSESFLRKFVKGVAVSELPRI